MKRFRSVRLHLESLEQRDCPAPLTLTTPDPYGNVRIYGTIDPAGLLVILTADNTFDIFDGGNQIANDLVIPGNLSITSDAAQDFVNVRFADGNLSGSLTINTGEGDDFVVLDNFSGGSRSIGGNLTVLSASSLLVTDVNIARKVTYDNRTGTVSFSGATFVNTTIGSGLSNSTSDALVYSGNNNSDAFLLAGSFVNGNVLAYLLGGTNQFDFIQDSTITNRLAITATSPGVFPPDLSNVFLDGTIGGDASVYLGNGDNNLQFSTLNLAGSLTVNTGSGADNLNIGSLASIGRNITVILGNGNNTFDFLGFVGGTGFTYIGGTGIDTVSFSGTSTSNSVRPYLSLGAGADVFTLNNTNMAALTVDFGAGNDTFDNVAGITPNSQIPFANRLLNLENII